VIGCLGRHGVLYGTATWNQRGTYTSITEVVLNRWPAMSSALPGTPATQQYRMVSMSEGVVRHLSWQPDLRLGGEAVGIDSCVVTAAS
jgi:hypothetical protein